MVLAAISGFIGACIWAVVKFALLFTAIVSVAAAFQERKNWHDVSLGIGGNIKIYVFLFLWMTTSGLSVLALAPLFIMGDKKGPRLLNTFFEYHIAANLFKVFCGTVKIVGEENIPDADEPCIYIFNHTSQLDVCLCYEVQRYFSWVAKKSITYVPGVGQLFYYGNHILLDRSGAESIKQLFEKAQERLIEDKRSIFIFPQGTRSRKEILSFKNGAFHIALNSGASLVPCTIELEKDAWCGGLMKPVLAGTMTIHEKIVVNKETDTVDSLREKCYKIIEAPFFGKIPERPYVKKEKKKEK